MSQAAEDARERELAVYMRTLAPKDTKRDNAVRMAGRPGKANGKDRNPPQKSLKAYFMCPTQIRSDPESVEEVLGGETNETKRCILAAPKRRSVTDDEREVRTHPS